MPSMPPFFLLTCFLSRPQEGTTAALLQRKPWGSREALQIQMQLGRRVPLEGEELRLWQEQQRARLMEAEPMAVTTEALGDGPGAALLTEAAVDELQTRSALRPCCKCLNPGTHTVEPVQGMTMHQEAIC